jgi:hypothetical protein
METFALHLGIHPGGAEDLDVGVHAIGDQPVGAVLQRGHLVRPGGQLELAVPQEVAIDGFLAHQPGHRVHRGVIGLVPGAGLRHADLGRDFGIVHRQAVVDMAAIAPRGFRGHPVAGFEHGHLRAALGQRQRRRQAGEAATDDGHVHLCGQFAPGRREGGRRMGPVGIELHGVGLR